MKKNILYPAWVEINLRNLAHNIHLIRKQIGDQPEIIGIVKADAYGHGSAGVAETLLHEGVSKLAVAKLSEAEALREAGFTCPILYLGAMPKGCTPLIAEYDLSPVLYAASVAEELSEIALASDKRIDVYIKIDTGMQRVGYAATQESIPEILKIAKMPNLHIAGFFSHFATSEEPDTRFACDQIARFNAFLNQLEASGIPTGLTSMANSGAILNLPDAYFHAVRPGVIMYGCHPAQRQPDADMPLRPVMSVKAQVAQLKTVPAGAGISYNLRYHTLRESKIATFNLGYADGYSRSINGNGRILINGQYAPIVGNICMDYCMADVTDIADVQAGDVAIFMGMEGELRITAEEIAEKSGTVNYEVLCGFGQRLPKRYIK